MPPQVDSDVAIAEAQALLERAGAADVLLRATGGVGIALISPSARRPPLRRSYGDIDFFGLSRDAAALGELFTAAGYEPEQEFNALHGQRRLFFREPRGRWEADVFLDRIEMCHQLDLRDQLAGHEQTLSPANLLLSKLQIIETNDKDLRDILALLGDHNIGEGSGLISLQRLADVCANDWGWFHTAEIVAQRALDAAQRWRGDADAQGVEALDHAQRRIGQILSHIDAAPKSRRWKMRAKVGERKRWYETPEDIDHEEAI